MWNEGVRKYERNVGERGALRPHIMKIAMMAITPTSSDDGRMIELPPREMLRIEWVGHQIAWDTATQLRERGKRYAERVRTESHFYRSIDSQLGGYESSVRRRDCTSQAMKVAWLQAAAAMVSLAVHMIPGDYGPMPERDAVDALKLQELIGIVEAATSSDSNSDVDATTLLLAGSNPITIQGPGRRSEFTALASETVMTAAYRRKIAMRQFTFIYFPNALENTRIASKALTEIGQLGYNDYFLSSRSKSGTERAMSGQTRCSAGEWYLFRSDRASRTSAMIAGVTRVALAANPAAELALQAIAWAAARELIRMAPRKGPQVTPHKDMTLIFELWNTEVHRQARALHPPAVLPTPPPSPAPGPFPSSIPAVFPRMPTRVPTSLSPPSPVHSTVPELDDLLQELRAQIEEEEEEEEEEEQEGGTV